MKLLLMRHGTTAWNIEKRIQGRIDQPLCEAGREALARLSLPDEFTSWQWYCSPLRRAIESAEILGVANYRVEEDLIEMNWGAWEGEILKPLRRRLGEEMRNNERRGIDFRPPGGESPREVQSRLAEWLARIAARGETAAAVAHKGIVRCIYSMASGWDMCGKPPHRLEWDMLHEFEVAPDGGLRNHYRALPLSESPD